MTEATATVRPQQVLPRIGGAVVLLAGLGLTALGLFADFRHSTRGGAFGLAQAIATCVGLAMTTAGFDLRRGRGSDWAASLAQVKSAALPLLSLLVQLALLVFVTGWFQIENPAFAQMVLPLAAAGFLIHHVLPVGHRLWYFAALSLIGFVLVLGWTNAAWLVGLTVCFVALCHLPLPWLGRVAALLVAGVLLGILRAQPSLTPFSSAIWPILGSILMFRLIVYAYDVRNSKERVPVRLSLAYFFMLPNVVFPLFPVVDFATFKRVHYDRDPISTYQRGVEWMVRGLLHLLLYRAVYQHFTLAPSEVATGAQLVQYMVSTFLLYLRVSGTFHFIIGMLHLFGFRLPETHRFFYLASSFTDFWRRINIYWKDFMMKLVFYPVYFPLRKRGETTALVVATLSVFLITWLTHSYQWFWILGTWLLSWTDGLFWAILGVLLVANSLWEAKHGRKRTLPGAGRKKVRESLVIAVKAVFVFTTICTLWSLWGTPTLGDWFDLMSVRRFAWTDWAAVLGILGVVAVAAFAGEMTGRSQGDADRGITAERTPWHRAALKNGGQLAFLSLITMPLFLNRTSDQVQQFARDMRVPELNKRDAAALQRGYYENLQGVSLQNNQLWELYAQRPAEGHDIWKSGVLRDRDDFLGRDMKPNFGIFERGRSFRTNRWGMRDRDYQQQKPPGVRRIAVMGQSYVAGDGVSDGETFDEVVEDRLARERPQSGIEILNFGVGSYSQLQQLLLLEERVMAFDPDAIMVVGHPGDAERITIHIVQQLRRGVVPPFEPLREILKRAEVTPTVRETEAMSRLMPYRDELLSWTLSRIAAAARAKDVRPVWVYLSTPERGPSPADVQRMVEQARVAGFDVLNWSDVYDGVDPKSVQASQWDFHPNAAGHQLIANRLHRELASDSLGVFRPIGASSAPRTQEIRP